MTQICDKYTRFAFKITLLLFVSAITGIFFFLTTGLGVLDPGGGGGSPDYYYHRQTKVHHDLFGQCKWKLTNDVTAHYRTSSWYDIISYSYTGQNIVYETNVWVTFGYNYEITTHSGGDGYLDWVKQKNWAHFETKDGVTCGIAYAENKLKESGNYDWSGNWVQSSGYFVWWFKSNVFISGYP